MQVFHYFLKTIKKEMCKVKKDLRLVVDGKSVVYLYHTSFPGTW